MSPSSASSSCTRSRASCCRPSCRSTARPPTSSGARKSRRTRAPGTRSSTTCRPAWPRARRSATPAAPARPRPRSATLPTTSRNSCAWSPTHWSIRPATRSSPNNTAPHPTHQGRHPMATEVKVPVLPESVSDATIAGWHKKAGDAVSRDENLVDLETDKVVLEVPSPVDGVLKEIKFKEGDTVTSQQLLAIIEEGAAPAADAGKDSSEPAAGDEEVQERKGAAKAEA